MEKLSRRTKQTNNFKKEGLKIMKKLICTILAMAMIVSAMGFTVFAAEITASTAEDFYNAVKNAQPGDVINLGDNVTYAGWDSIGNKDSITINGNNHTITINPPGVDSGINGGGLFLTASNLKINDLKVVLPEHSAERPRLATMKSGTLNNVTVTGGTYAVSLIDEGPVVIKDCVFEGQSDWTIETEGKATTAALTITDCEFEENAVILRGENNTFTGNVITGEAAKEGVNVLGDAVIKNNDFGTGSLGINSGVDVTIENNIINTVEFSTWYVGEGEEPVYDEVKVVNNTLSESAVATLQTKAEEVQGEIVSVPCVAKVDGKPYYNLSDALAAATGETATITLMEGEYNIADFKLGTQTPNPYPYASNLKIVGDGNVTINLTSEEKSYQNDNKAYQYFLGGNWSVCGDSFAVENIDFVFEDTNTTDEEFMAELQVYANNSISFTGCTFDNVSVSPWGNQVTKEGPASATFSGCEFKNISARSAIHQAKADALTVTGNTFTNVVSGMHVVAKTPASLTVTGNTFTGLAEGSAAIYFGTEGEDYSAATITVTGNTADGALVRNRNESLTLTQTAALADETKNTFETAFTSNANDVKFVATIDGVKGYTTLDDAIADANGAKITALADVAIDTTVASNSTINIDLAGNTLYVNAGSNYLVGNNSISNGTVDISKASSSQNIFGLAQYDDPKTTMTLDNVNFIGDGYNSGYGIFEIGNSGAEVALTVKNSTINLKNDKADKGGFVKGNSSDDAFTLTNTTVKLDNTDMFVVNVDADITDSEITIANLSGTALRNIGGTISNSDIVITNSENGIRTDSVGYNLEVTNDSRIVVTGSTNTEEGEIGDVVLGSGLTINVDTTSELLVESSSIAEGSEITGNFVSMAETVYVQFRKIDDETKDKEFDKYEIVLAGNGEKINELASADLTFDYTLEAISDGDMSVTVLPATGVTISQTGKTDEENRYMFNYDGINKYEETKTEIVIGTVTVDGYGSYTLGVKDVGTNAVYATEIVDNIVDGFTPAANNLVVNEDMIENDGMVGKIAPAVTIDVPTYALNIEIDFPNTVNDNAAAYQNMTVSIVGGNINKELKLGTDAADTDTLYPATIANKGTATAAKYAISVNLPYNTTYTVTVEGAGYRTARHSVALTEAKTLKFWNNVKDNAEAIEAGKNEMTKNFLAGEIVKDNKINVYDLSAVVSYFGQVDLNKAGETYNSNYAKYDLNRDGKIDSLDVAYVLVSWNE